MMLLGINLSDMHRGIPICIDIHCRATISFCDSNPVPDSNSFVLHETTTGARIVQWWSSGALVCIYCITVGTVKVLL